MMKFKRGFTLLELLVVMSMTGFISSAIFPSFSNTRALAEDIVRIHDIQSLMLAMEISRDIFTDEYRPLSYTTPAAIGTELPEVPRNNSENAGIYGWIDNTMEPHRYCAWAKLTGSDFEPFYVAGPRGAGFMDEEPTSFDTCIYYQEGSTDSGADGTNENDKKAFVCHQSKKGKLKTLNIGIGAIDAHLAHGDTLGRCPGDD